MRDGLVLVNPRSGSDATDVASLRAAFPHADVEACEPATLRARVKDAVAENRPFVGIAGGDGSIRTAADVLLGSEVALLAIPAGTRNHFSQELGICSVEDAVAAARVETVDVATCNGVTFVNNSSIGIYPGIVLTREATSHLPKPLANALALLRQLRAGHGLRVVVDRRELEAWMVFVGNGCYGEHMDDLMSRDSLHDHVLDVRIVRADHRFARLRLVVAFLTGRLASSAVVERRTCRSIEIAVRGPRPVEVALDGEVEVLHAPLRYESVPDGLRVLAP